MPDHLSEPDRASVIETLRAATRKCHADLGASAAMSRLFDSDYTLPEYRAHLGRLLGILEPLESAAARAAEAAGCACPLLRSGDLREDLRCMGATEGDIDALERCRRLPAISPAGLRGYTYVILGSCLGARIIVRQLRAVLGQGASFRFYGDEGGRFEAAWASFRADLEENGKNHVEVICATAVGIFNAYGAWFAEPPSPIQEAGDGPF
jgi:heme oxygenase